MVEWWSLGIIGYDGYFGFDDVGFGDDIWDVVFFGFDVVCGVLLDYVVI